MKTQQAKTRLIGVLMSKIIVFFDGKMMLLNKKLTSLHLEKFYKFNINKAFLVIIAHVIALFTQGIHKLKGHPGQAGELQKAGHRHTGIFYTNDGTPKSSWLVK